VSNTTNASGGWADCARVGVSARLRKPPTPERLRGPDGLDGEAMMSELECVPRSLAMAGNPPV
jgi:hypothetical protein